MSKKHSSFAERFSGIALVLLIFVSICLPVSVYADEKMPIPEILRFRQEVQAREKIRDCVYIQRVYPVTANEQVNAEMRQVIDDLIEANRRYLPTEPVRIDQSYLKAGSNITRTGTRWMSFLTVAMVKHGYEQTHVAFDARTYDVESGKSISLSEVVSEAGWNVLADAVQEQLSTYFPDEEAEQLEMLCSREKLAETPFTLTPCSLRLHYKADALYPGRESLMHVSIPYGLLRSCMTQTAADQTDNSCYKLIALTFDDGPAYAYSTNVVELLQRYGAEGTFFLIGRRLANEAFVVAMEHDAGHSIGYHSYTHQTEGNISAIVQPEWEKYRQELTAMIGRNSLIMRAPGGYEEPYIKAEIGLPIIHWSIGSGDGHGGPNETTATFIEERIRTVCGNACDGAVVLMHDLRSSCTDYLRPILEYLEKNGFLCVTVEELFASEGIELKGNTVYYGATKN